MGQRRHWYGQFDTPFGITVDALDNLYVVDHYNHRIQVFVPEPTTLLLFGLGGLVLRRKRKA